MNISSSQTNSSSGSSFNMWYFFPSFIVVTPLGVPANALVLRALVGKAGICSTSEIFTTSQAFMDLAFCVGLCIETIYNLITKNRHVLKSLAFNQFGGPLHLTVTCLDSYLGVIYPITFMKLKAPEFRVSICAVIWVSTLAYFIGTVVSPSLTSWGVMITQLTVDLVIMYTCLIQVLWALNQAGPGRTEVHPVKRRAFKTVLSMFILINVHYCLPVVDYISRQIAPSTTNEFRPLAMIAFTLQSMSSCVNPIFYLVRAKKCPLPFTCQGRQG